MPTYIFKIENPAEFRQLAGWGRDEATAREEVSRNLLPGESLGRVIYIDTDA